MGADDLWAHAVSMFRPRTHEMFHARLFLPNDFEVLDSEQYLELYQGSREAKNEYSSLGDFAVATLFSLLEDIFAQRDFDSIAARVDLKDVSPDEFWRQLSERTEGLKYQPDFTLDGPIVRVYQLLDYWNFVACAAETVSNYYALYWKTTVHQSSH